MNLFSRLIHVFLFIIFLIHISIYSTYQINGSKQQFRNKRDNANKNENEIKDGQFPYLVFLYSLTNYETFNVSSKCMPIMCSGTLIHQRFVLTHRLCIEDTFGTKIRIFSRGRPYDVKYTNMSYLTAEEIYIRPANKYDNFHFILLALILMNDTFPEVTSFAKFLTHAPVVEGKIYKCFAVKYSLLGRDIPMSVVEPIIPLTYSVNVQMNFSDCHPYGNMFPVNRLGMYMCNTIGDNDKYAMCDYGDLGSPLLCEVPSKYRSRDGTVSKSRYRRREVDGRADGRKQGGEEPYVLGLTYLVRNDNTCGMKVINEFSRNVWLYMYPYMHWINGIINEFEDALQGDDADVYDGANSSTTVTAANATTATTSTTTPTTTTLPEYYDMDDYLNTRNKKAMRCRGPVVADRRLTANYHRSSYVAENSWAPSVTSLLAGKLMRSFAVPPSLPVRPLLTFTTVVAVAVPMSVST